MSYHFVKVFLFHAQLNKEFYASPAYKLFQEYTQIVLEILEDGKRDGSIRKDINNRVFKYLFLGAFSHMALRWLILGDKKTEKMREINEAVMLLSRAVSTKN